MGRQVKPKAYDIMAPTCPSRVILNRIGARWTIFVVVALADRPMRFSELKTRIRGITSKALTETLRAMARDGLIQRTEHGGQPPAVEYALTALGRSLLVPLAAVRQWAENHVTEVLDANMRADESDFIVDVFGDDVVRP
ncbi:winged helix-turn-helix transcriptional regulator [Mycobacterium lacus]|uniref:Transcriptional regulator n=1 Tax=Mycobacterium lacus TaxID=169765 RepID=A0A1X1Y1Y2_9MYCO|nr:helix-turn-helix domain-containing protein [Mycobacterium lacus]MCV7122467.1 helix-turn-helix transcriptional regulator [Mycobacterium lacus]ORW05098.1 HxlR family transcriptional regulator [Mycobacterium lacus]BBX95296.1 transcriptional regulator [Mycobacterium lacus]